MPRSSTTEGIATFTIVEPTMISATATLMKTRPAQRVRSVGASSMVLLAVLDLGDGVLAGLAGLLVGLVETLLLQRLRCGCLAGLFACGLVAHGGSPSRATVTLYAND